jgi:prepilin-type processing-associated H-X9-DG protein
MKPNTAQPIHHQAFTVVELIVIVFAGIMLFVLLFTGIPRIRKEARLKQCSDNLKQVGLAFRIWSGDSTDRMPMQYPSIQGGSMESVTNGAVFHTFQVMSNELSEPKILVCPMDDRRPVTNFHDLSNLAISYFVNVDALDIEPFSFLTGDRNLTNGPLSSTRLLSISTNSTLGWSENLHRFVGNICFADGSVQTRTTPELKPAVTNMLNGNYPLYRLAFP